MSGKRQYHDPVSGAFSRIRRSSGWVTTSAPSRGRETAIDPVEWRPDGWFTVNGCRGETVDVENADELIRDRP